MRFDPMPKLAEIRAQAPALMAVSQVSQVSQSPMARDPAPPSRKCRGCRNAPATEARTRQSTNARSLPLWHRLQHGRRPPHLDGPHRFAGRMVAAEPMGKARAGRATRERHHMGTRAPTSEYTNSGRENEPRLRRLLLSPTEVFQTGQETATHKVRMQNGLPVKRLVGQTERTDTHQQSHIVYKLRLGQTSSAPSLAKGERQKPDAQNKEVHPDLSHCPIYPKHSSLSKPSQV